MQSEGGFSLFRWTRKRPKRDRREVWQEVARSVGGTFVPGKRSSTDEVEISHGPWTIVLDTYTVHTGEASVTYTRAKAVFSGPVDLRPRIRRRNFFDAILENVGLGGVDPGDRSFAERFVVRGRPETRIRSLVTPQLVEALLAEPKASVKVKERLAEGSQAPRSACPRGLGADDGRDPGAEPPRGPHHRRAGNVERLGEGGDGGARA